ncbi:MAG: hypothetical protein HQ481_01665 [Alphaproteobacteria bacterium]|nr:hypothetical protein [Alphaproteobacteria bacterium]
MAWTSMDTFVDACRTAATSADPAEAVRAVMIEAVADPARVVADLPDFEGEDVVVAHDDAVAVYVVRQSPDTAGPPHDHRMTAVVGMIEGVEIHRLFRRQGERVAFDREARIGPGEVIVLGPDEVHAIANPDRHPSLGLHVYLGDIVTGERALWAPDGGEQQPFTVEAYDRYVTRYGG